GKVSDVKSLQSKLGGDSSACNGHPASSIATSCTALHKALVGRDTMAKGAVVGFTLGGVLALGTAGLALLAAPRSKATAKVGEVRVLPVLGREVQGAAVVGAW